MESPLQKLIDKMVVVKTGTVAYRGRLVEVTEESVSLMARTGWREVPMDRIVAIERLPDPQTEEPAEEKS